ncbi:GtrA family protein [Ferruginibacter sp.]
MSKLFDARFFKFGIVGVSGMLLDFSVTWLCKEKLRLNKYLSNSLGVACAVVSNFLLNRYWTFDQHAQPFAAQFSKFVCISLLGIAINNLLLYFLVKNFKANFYVLKLVVIGLVFFWNYILNTLFTFN